LRSEIRFRIDELFRENGITIAFPQQDVHLDGKLHLVDERNSVDD
jgi:small-conductance mechanosensitive channel